MLKVYVISAKNLPACDSNGTSDPYVIVSSVDKNKFRFGKTASILNTLNPVWDQSLQHPLMCPYTRATSIVFDIYDKDRVSKDDYIGAAEFDLLIHPIGQPITLDVENVQYPVKRPPKLMVQVDYPSSNFPVDKDFQKPHHITFSLTYDPFIPVSSHAHPPELSFIAIHQNSQLLERIYGGMTPPPGVRFDSMAQHLGPGGRTQVVRVNIGKSPDLTFIPFVKTNFYRGTITVNFTAFAKEPKKDGERIVEDKKLNCGTIIHESSVAALEDGLYSLGSIMSIEKGVVSFSDFAGSLCTTNYVDLASSVDSKYKNFSQRYNISFGNSVSLSEISEFHNIKVPHNITFGLGWKGAKDLDTFAVVIDKNWTCVAEVTGKKNKYQDCIIHMGDSKSGKEESDSERISVNLDKIPKDVKAICICATYKTGVLCDIHNVYMRVLTTIKDKEKELMYLPVTARKKQNSLLFAILYPTKDGLWDLFPLSRLFESKNIQTAKDYINEFFEISGIVEDVIECND